MDHDEPEEPKDRLRALREALGLTQEGVADRSGGRLSRTEVVKAEKHGLGLSSVETRRGLADAYGLLLVDDLSDYMDGKLSIEETLRIIEDDRLAGGHRRRGSPKLRDRKEWGEALADAKRYFRTLPHDAYDPIGNLVDSLPMRLTGMVLGELARSVWEARKRDEHQPEESAERPTNPSDTVLKHSKGS